MLVRTKQRLDLKPKRLAYGTDKFIGWLVGAGITPHVPVWEKANRSAGTFSRSDITLIKRRTNIGARTGRSCEPPGRRPHDSLSSQQVRLRSLSAKAEMLSKHALAQGASRRE